MTTFQAPEPLTATIEIGAGDITVIAGHRADATVTVLPRDEGNQADQRAAAGTVVDLIDGELTIRTPKTWRRFTSKNDGAVRVTVELPAGCALTATTGFGSITTEGELGATAATTGMGDLLLGEVGALRARSGFGDISAVSTRDAKVRTGTGTVRLGSVEGSATITNASGGVEVAECARDLHVRTSSGDIIVGRARASVTAGSAAGDIEVAEVASGTVSLRTGAGSITIGVRDGAAAWLELNSTFGVVRNGLTVTSSPAESESRVEVRARTGAGDITVERAA